MGMNEYIPIIVALIASIPSVLALLEVKKVHILINSRMDELLKLTKVASKAEGVVEGRAEGHKK